MALETLTYLEIGMGGAPGASHAGVLALRRAASRSAAGFDGGRLTPLRVRWHLDAATLPEGFEARVGDQLLDADGARWAIASTRLCTLGTRWELETEAA